MVPKGKVWFGLVSVACCLHALGGTLTYRINLDPVESFSLHFTPTKHGAHATKRHTVNKLAQPIPDKVE